MRSVNRRDAVKLTAGLAVGAGALDGQVASGQQAEQLAADPALEQALKNPQNFMFSEQVTFELEGDMRGFSLFITSARDPNGLSESVRVPPGSMRIFRAEADHDEFTRQGGMYWRIRDTEGKVQFKTPGPLVMVVRDHDGTVRCYSLEIDLRC